MAGGYSSLSEVTEVAITREELSQLLLREIVEQENILITRLNLNRHLHDRWGYILRPFCGDYIISEASSEDIRVSPLLKRLVPDYLRYFELDFRAKLKTMGIALISYFFDKDDNSCGADFCYQCGGAIDWEFLYVGSKLER